MHSLLRLIAAMVLLALAGCHTPTTDIVIKPPPPVRY